MQRTNDAGSSPKELTPIPVFRNAASFTLSPQMLERSLSMPAGVKITGVEWDFINRAARIFVEGDGLPEVHEGEALRHLTPTLYRKVEDGRETVAWAWNI